MKSFETNTSDHRLMIDKIHAKALESCEQDSIKIEDFKNLYGEENIQKDLAYVKEMERIFETQSSPEQKEMSKLALIFETIINKQIEQSNWLGPNTFTIKSSRFDDIKNGVDNIVEFREEDSASYLALGIDETFSSDIGKKFNRIKEEINRGSLATIKYFASEHMNIRGEITKIPRVVIGADAKTATELGELWIEKDEKTLGKHSIQFLIIEEILFQLEAFENYALKINKPEIASIYAKNKKIMEEIANLKNKSKTDDDEFFLQNDNIFQAIKDNLEIFY
ncbi:hypothetical protein HZB04_01110 [Candidatus Wolfebacteria bacterium]|nr:hypothetical protein [Candidatus Wolfebacteria bacterium]